MTLKNELRGVLGVVAIAAFGGVGTQRSTRASHLAPARAFIKTQRIAGQMRMLFIPTKMRNSSPPMIG